MTPKTDSPRRIGLARALSKLGHCSRSEAQRKITAGRIRLNGRLVLDPQTPVVLGADKVEVDNEIIAAAKKIYLVMNKPRGMVTTANDEKGRVTVLSLLPLSSRWLAPVGRLDKASEGLLLFTNDSEWAGKVTAPETHLDKTYHVQIAAIADQSLMQQLRFGVRTDDNLLRVKRATIVRQGKKNSWIEVVLSEGKNRHIRRLLAGLNIEVLRLIRIAIGPLALGDLPKGKIRELKREEKARLDKAMAGRSARAS